MAEKHVVTALVQKRGEIVGQIEHTQTMLRKLVSDLDNIDAAIRIFAPDYDLENIKVKLFPRAFQAFRGEVTRHVFDTLRAASAPMTTQEIALGLMTARGMNTGDLAVVRTMTQRVGSRLRDLRNAGLVRSVVEAGELMKWEGVG